MRVSRGARESCEGECGERVAQRHHDAMCKQTFFLRLEGREGESSSGRSAADRSLRVESRRARWMRFDGLTMITAIDGRVSEEVQEQGHARQLECRFDGLLV